VPVGDESLQPALFVRLCSRGTGGHRSPIDLARLVSSASSTMSGHDHNDHAHCGDESHDHDHDHDHDHKLSRRSDAYVNPQRTLFPMVI